MLQSYQGIISDGQPSTLPTKRVISHRIDLIPGATLPKKVSYKMTPQQNKEISRQIQELLNQGLIKKIISPCVVPTILAPKKGGTWRFYTNSRAINSIQVQIPYPQDFLSEAKYYRKIDLKSGYHQIRIHEGDEWKITFKTNEGLYEFKIHKQNNHQVQVPYSQD